MTGVIDVQVLKPGENIPFTNALYNIFTCVV